MSKLPMPPGLKVPLPPLTLGDAQVKTEDNSLTIPKLGKIDFKSTNRDFSLEENETQKIINENLKPLHATDPNILRFIDNYLYCRDARQAAKLTGLNGRDGKNLMERKDIATCVAKLTSAAVRKYGYDAEEIVERVKEVAFIDPADIQRDDGSFINNLREMAPETRRAIRKMKVKNLFDKDPNGMPILIGEVIEIEFWDKMKAVELLGREKGTFKNTTVVEHGVSKNMRDVLLATTKRAEDRMKALEDKEVIDVNKE